MFAYIASLPQPQRGIAEGIDALAAKCLPDVHRAVKWGMAYYGVDGGWCFSSGAFVGHVKLMFIRGTEIKPEPPVTLPWGTKLCLNGHEWAKRQLEKRKIAYEALDNGFLSCADPAKLQQICDCLGPESIDRVFRKWLRRIPLPLRTEDREAGYDWDLSIWQMEVSLTQIFDRPLRGREFFEEIIRDNLDLGRPDRVQLIFDRVVTKKTPGEFKTRVIQDGVHPSLHINYKNIDLKQYFKEGRGCRTEGTFRNPNDFGVNKGLSNLPYLQKIGRQINRRLLEVERVSHNSGLSGDSIQRGNLETKPYHGTLSGAVVVTSPKLLPGWKHSFANHHAWVLYHPPPGPRIRHAYAWC